MPPRKIKKAPKGTSVTLRITKIRDGDFKWDVMSVPTESIRLLLEELRGSLQQRSLF